jgi:hypothetical protein
MSGNRKAKKRSLEKRMRKKIDINCGFGENKAEEEGDSQTHPV